MPIFKNTSSVRDGLSKSYRVRPYIADPNPIIEEWDLEPDIQDVEISKSIITEVHPTDFVEFAVVIPDQASKQLKQFSFAERRYLKPVYDTTSPRVLLKCGRQVEKSTYLGNRLLALT